VSFNVLTVRSGLDTGNDALYPTLSSASDAEVITLDGYDGQQVTKIVATAVRVHQVSSNGLKVLIRLQDVKIDIYITDSRLALACEKYDKGGGWVGFGAGGLLVAVTANAVSKARAASRTRGKVLVGHIRYPWLKSVGASSKSGFATSEAIRLEYSERQDGATVRKIVELILPKNIDATLVAQDVTRRAAAYRLAYYPDMPGEERVKFASLNEAPPRLQPPPKKFAFVPLPTYYHANAATAFPRTSEPAQPADPALPAGSTLSDEPALPAGSAPAAAVFPAPAVFPAASGSSGADGIPAPRHAASFCTQCGVRLVPGNNFCSACGAPTDSSGQPNQGNGVASY
jgi:hypothetical protein